MIFSYDISIDTHPSLKVHVASFLKKTRRNSISAGAPLWVEETALSTGRKHCLLILNFKIQCLFSFLLVSMGSTVASLYSLG